MDDRSTAISAAEVADDGAEIAAAVKVAKAFRDKLEAAGISYHKLLALEEARRDITTWPTISCWAGRMGRVFRMNENTMLVPQMGINMEQATANCEELAKAIHEITAGVLTTVNSFCRWIQRVAAEVAAQQEMEMALRWASVDNRPLYNRYRHTKKKRIRKKYAKRILEWYRTEVAPC